MLILARKRDEVVKIGENIEVKVLEIRGGTVRLGFEAPKDVLILRSELVPHATEDNATDTIDPA